MPRGYYPGNQNRKKKAAAPATNKRKPAKRAAKTLAPVDEIRLVLSDNPPPAPQPRLFISVTYKDAETLLESWKAMYEAAIESGGITVAIEAHNMPSRLLLSQG